MVGIILRGQDIHSLELGLWKDGRLLEAQTVEAMPESYLAAVDAALRAWRVAPADLDAVAVVTGPGSFTALRVSTTIVNGIGFARDIPVFSVEDPDRISLEALAKRVDWSASAAFAAPAYDKPPHITRPKPV